MRLHKMLSVFVFISSVSACDNEPPKSKIENPLAGHVDALDKAKNLEQELLDQHNKALEKSNVK